MNKTFLRRFFTLVSSVILISFVISCEKDFTDIGSGVISNTEFNTNDTVFEIEVASSNIDRVRADGIVLGALGQYLLGVYNNPNYKKIEASIVSQIAINGGVSLVSANNEYSIDTLNVNTSIDTAYIKLPYQVIQNQDGKFELDSIIGDLSKAFSLNIYRSNTFLNRLNPSNPSQGNVFQSDFDYEKIPGELNSLPNYQFIPDVNDTIAVVKRRTTDGTIYQTDSIALSNNFPYAKITLDEQKIKTLFLDQFGSSNFETQEAFNDYFRGIILEATGNEGSLVSFDFDNQLSDLNPSLEIHYTNIVYDGIIPIDTIAETRSFQLSGIRNSVYKMNSQSTSSSSNFPIQGTAGSHGIVKLFGTADVNGNNILDKIEELRTNNWLINDASITFYVDKNISANDTTNTPFRLLLYKDGLDANGRRINSHVPDIYSEGITVYGGFLQVSSDRKPDSYTFRITNYIANLLNGSTDFSPDLKLKVFNPTDFPSTLTDTIISDYNWNPKAVMLLNHLQTNGDRRAQLKISYSKKLTD